MICKTSSAYAKWTSSLWHIRFVAIAASIGLHALALTGVGWLVDSAPPESAPAKRLDIALAPANVSTTQTKQHHVKRVKAAPSIARNRKTALKPAIKEKKSAGAPVSTSQPVTQANQSNPKEQPRQLAAEVTSATPVRLSAQYAATNRKPSYPILSRRSGEEGTVILRVFVTTDGRAGQVKVKTSSGYPLLDKSAKNAVRNWRFQPATTNARPVAEWYELSIPFKLLDQP